VQHLPGGWHCHRVVRIACIAAAVVLECCNTHRSSRRLQGNCAAAVHSIVGQMHSL
jgi:hypothetical protein